MPKRPALRKILFWSSVIAVPGGGIIAIATLLRHLKVHEKLIDKLNSFKENH